MAKIEYYDIDDIETLCEIGKALSSPVRVEMMQLLYENSMIIGEIAKKMNLPASSTAFHLKILEQAGLIRMEKQPGERGSTKLCTRKVDSMTINMIHKNTDVNQIYSAELPVGGYSSCSVTPTCGMYDQNGVIGSEDTEFYFYDSRHVNAGLLWTSSGYFEYKFANGIPKKARIKKLTFSAEICSEAPGYSEDWKSDITLWINGIDCGTWTCPGDFGGRRGRLNSSVVPNGSTQYGMMVHWEVCETGVYAEGRRISTVTLDALNIMERPYISVKIGNKPNALYEGGLNLFGKHFGDYDQDLILSAEYV